MLFFLKGRGRRINLSDEVQGESFAGEKVEERAPEYFVWVSPHERDVSFGEYPLGVRVNLHEEGIRTLIGHNLVKMWKPLCSIQRRWGLWLSFFSPSCGLESDTRGRGESGDNGYDE